MKNDEIASSKQLLKHFREALYQDMNDAISEVIYSALNDEDTHLYFPIELSKNNKSKEGTDGFGGSEVTDPLTLYLIVGIDKNDRRPTGKFNLRDALVDSINACWRDGSFSIGLGLLSAEFRKLADEIDKAIIKFNEK